MLLSERIAADEITITKVQLPTMSDDGKRKTWSVILHRPDGREFMLPDPYESNDTPTAFDVLDLVTGACAIIDQSADWREWATEYVGKDRKEQDKHFSPERFDRWADINNALREFLGHQGHEDYLYDTDRDG